MKREDRELLSRLRRANNRIADDTLSVVLGVDAADGEPSAEALRAIADELDVVAADLRARADTIPLTVDAVDLDGVEPPR